MKILILKDILKHPDIYQYIDVLDEEERYITINYEIISSLPKYITKYPYIVVQDYCNAYRLWGYNNNLKITVNSVLQDNLDINTWFKDQEDLFLANKLDELL